MMSVFNTKYDDVCNHHEKSKCNICEHRLTFPFMCWEGANPPITICGHCCQEIKRGFTADLVQLAATMEMQGLGYRFGDTVLVRRSTKRLEAEGEKQRREVKILELNNNVCK
jgi:hypothetical protein